MSRRIIDMFCSDCFKNEGLRLEAEKLGQKRSKACPRCGSTAGAFLDAEKCDELMFKFFIEGTCSNHAFGISLYRPAEGNIDQIQFDATLQKDFEALAAARPLGLRLRAPKTWLIGDTEHWEAFEEMLKYRRKEGRLPENASAIVDELLERCRKFTLPKGTKFYRIRKNPEGATLPDSYDAPSAAGRTSRLSRGSVPVLYGAFDIETCIHESRCRIDDEICIATVETLTDLEALDLGNAPHDPKREDPWTSPAIFLSQVMRRPQHDECQIIGERAFERGITAIQFPSFFSQVLDRQHSNIAIFGRPIEEGKAHVQSLNRIKLERVKYDFILGPVFSD